MSNRRRVIAAVLVGAAAILYGISPIDVIPELFTGPLGLADDAVALLGAGFAVWKLLSGRGRPGDATPPPAAGV